LQWARHPTGAGRDSMPNPDTPVCDEQSLAGTLTDPQEGPARGIRPSAT
jgi:hypothetical protein